MGSSVTNASACTKDPESRKSVFFLNNFKYLNLNQVRITIVLTHRCVRSNLGTLLNKLSQFSWAFFGPSLSASALELFPLYVSSKIILKCQVKFLAIYLRSMSFTLAIEAPSYNNPKASVTIRILGKRRQQTFIVQEPDIPWHLQIRCILDLNALLPASLLCKFISPTSVLEFSGLSMNFLENCTP